MEQERAGRPVDARPVVLDERLVGALHETQPLAIIRCGVVADVVPLATRLVEGRLTLTPGAHFR